MNALNTPEKKPFITLDDEQVAIAAGNKKFSFSVAHIAKIHISKRRRGYFSAAIGAMLALRDNTFNLCVSTDDGQETKIPITRLERYYCIKLISALRQSLGHKPDFV
jgi:hypothetical protein